MTPPVQTTLVTGATGFLGSALLPRLLSDPQQRVYAIVRAADAAKLEARRLKYLSSLPDCFNPDQLIFMNGDLTKSRLGLGDDDLRRVFDDVDSIIHMAASTRFDLTREQAQEILSLIHI